jgi:uncharacterized protein YggU (UPF0235/DUF167 family)
MGHRTPASARQANAAPAKLVSNSLGVRKPRVPVAEGRTARDKVVRVDGLSPADAHELLSSS